jgi:hypothetical protein
VPEGKGHLQIQGTRPRTLPTGSTTHRPSNLPGSRRSSRSGPIRRPTCLRKPSTVSCHQHQGLLVHRYRRVGGPLHLRRLARQRAVAAASVAAQGNYRSTCPGPDAGATHRSIAPGSHPGHIPAWHLHRTARSTSAHEPEQICYERNNPVQRIPVQFRYQNLVSQFLTTPTRIFHPFLYQSQLQ